MSFKYEPDSEPQHISESLRIMPYLCPSKLGHVIKYIETQVDVQFVVEVLL